jgi:hypothetical protein
MKELLNVLEWLSIFGMAAALAAKFVGWLPRNRAYLYVVICCALGMVVDGLQGYIGDLVISALLTLFWIAMWKANMDNDDEDGGIPEGEEEEEEEEDVERQPSVITLEPRKLAS